MSNLLNNRDARIVSRSFRFIAPNLNDVNDVFNRVDYDLETSYFSTAVGDNKYINPLPGFGLNTDPSPAIASTGIKTDGEYNKLGGMGRYYKRIYDDNAVLLTLTAGAPEFTGILRFLTNAFDYSASLITNKGRTPGYIFYITQAAASIAFYPMQLIGTGMNFLSFLSDAPKNQWYYHKSTMGIYFGAAQGIFNDLMVGAGLALTVFNDSKQFQGNAKYGDAEFNTGTLTGYTEKDEYTARKENLTYLNSLYGDAINEDGTIDVVKIVTRGARKYRYFLKSIKDLDKRIGSQKINVRERDDNIRKKLEGLVKNPDFLNGTVDGHGNKGTAYYLNKERELVGAERGGDEILQPELASAYYDNKVAAQIKPTGKDGTADVYSTGNDSVVNKVKGINQNLPGNTPKNAVNATGDYGNQTLSPDSPTQNISVDGAGTEDGWLGKTYGLLQDMFLGGLDAVTFRVEGGTGPVSDSFSNETKQPEIASYFNGTVSAVNDFRFNTQGGATGVDFIDGFINRIKEGVAGLASGSVIGNIPLALMGNSRVNLPEHWSDSLSNLHTESYELYFEAMYGEPYSIATQIFLPLSLLMPFFTPVSTGGSSYTSPFICKAFCQGRSVINLGIVKNASLTFGEGELGWTKGRLPRTLRVNLEVADLEPVMAIPIGRLKNPLDVVNIAKVSGQYLGSVGKYESWVHRTTGREYLDTILTYSRLNQRLTRFKNDFEHIFSSSNISSVVSDSVVGTASRIFSGTNLRR